MTEEKKSDGNTKLAYAGIPQCKTFCNVGCPRRAEEWE